MGNDIQVDGTTARYEHDQQFCHSAKDCKEPVSRRWWSLLDR